MRSSRLTNTQKEKIKHRIYAAFLLVAICTLVYCIKGINTNMESITKTINSLNERQEMLEDSIGTLNTELQNQQAITQKITGLLEKQNNIEGYDGDPAFYGGMSDRSSTTTIGATRGSLNPLVAREVALDIRIENVEKAQEANIEQLEAKKNDFSTFYAPVSGDTDLGRYVNISKEEFNKWVNEKAPKSSPFYNKGDVFLKASEITGLDPKYIFAHAALESGYGSSHLALTRGNYFGINAVDSNPGAAYHMGECLESGVIEGAKWIKEKYYNKGRTTLNKMKAAGYASDDKWVSMIVSLMN